MLRANFGSPFLLDGGSIRAMERAIRPRVPDGQRGEFSRASKRRYLISTTFERGSSMKRLLVLTLALSLSPFLLAQTGTSSTGSDQSGSNSGNSSTSSQTGSTGSASSNTGATSTDQSSQSGTSGSSTDTGTTSKKHHKKHHHKKNSSDTTNSSSTSSNPNSSSSANPQ